MKKYYEPTTSQPESVINGRKQMILNLMFVEFSEHYMPEVVGGFILDAKAVLDWDKSKAREISVSRLDTLQVVSAGIRDFYNEDISANVYDMLLNFESRIEKLYLAAI